jgi:hypothetical protein
MKNPLIKYNKLKRFAAHVYDKVLVGVEREYPKIDCLFNGDIYTRRDMWEKMDAIAECASLVEMRKYEDHSITIHNANYCHNPIVCPVCADRISKRRRAIFDEPIRRAVRKFAVDRCSGDWRSEYPRNYTGVYLATATIENGPNLKEQIDTLHESSRRMMKKGQKRGRGRSLGEWSKVRAAIGNYEIKRGKGSGRWHVHTHYLLFTDRPIDITRNEGKYEIVRDGKKIVLSKWSHEWFEATGGKGINFDIKPVQYRSFSGGRKHSNFEDSVVSQAQEVLKYSTVLSERKGTGLLGSAQYVELIQRRGTRRLFNTYGLMRCDKRNPESLMTVSERELRRLEYVESIDQKHYEVYASRWQNGGSYGEPILQDGALFSSSDDMKTKWINIRRRSFLAQTAKYQGEYRKSRRTIFDSREMYIDKNFFEKMLDDCRDAFRRKTAELWSKYSDMSFIPEFLCEFTSGGMMEFREKHLLQMA